MTNEKRGSVVLGTWQFSLPSEKRTMAKKKVSIDEQSYQMSEQGSSTSVADPNSDEPSNSVKFRFHLSEIMKRNPYPLLTKWFLIYPLLGFIFWLLTYIYYGDDALPGGSVFALEVLEILAVFLGLAAESVNLPPHVGMLLAGLLLGNSPPSFGLEISFHLSVPLRRLSIIMFLMKAALNVNLAEIKHFRAVIFRLVFSCCIIEAVTAALAIYFILGFPKAWSFYLGCAFSSMSGTFELPYLQRFEKFESESNTLRILQAGCGLDAIVSICLALVALGFEKSDGFSDGITKGTVEIIIGGAIGILWGSIAGILLNDTYSSELRSLSLPACAIASYFGMIKMGFPRGASIACYTGTLITTNLWRNNKDDAEHNTHLSSSISTLWYFFQPILIGLLGYAIDLAEVDWHIILNGILCLVISLAIRFCTAFSTVGTIAAQLTFKEKLFVGLAWMPKAAGLAMLGSVAFDISEDPDSDAERRDIPDKIACISGIVIMVTSCFGAMLLLGFGPILLKRTSVL